MQFKANYSDGSFLLWDEDTQSEKAYTKVDRTKLTGIELYTDGKLVHKLHLEKGQRLILRRRVKHNIITNEFTIVYIVGFNETINSVDRPTAIIIFEDGHTELITAWKDTPFDKVELMDCEK